MSLNLPFGVYVSTRDFVDLKYEVLDDTARDLLITDDLVKKGKLIYHVTDDEIYRLKEYPTYGSLTGVVWVPLGGGGSMTGQEISNLLFALSNTNNLTDALLVKINNLLANSITTYIVGEKVYDTTKKPLIIKNNAIWSYVGNYPSNDANGDYYTLTDFNTEFANGDWELQTKPLPTIRITANTELKHYHNGCRLIIDGTGIVISLPTNVDDLGEDFSVVFDHKLNATSTFSKGVHTVDSTKDYFFDSRITYVFTKFTDVTGTEMMIR